jgi:hypothetical protein
MQKINMLVTDVTKVGDERCVAGWDFEKRRMIRPEPSPGAFWNAALTRAGGVFEAGAIASFTVKSREPSTRYPHRTEDRIVIDDVLRLRAPNQATMLRTLRSIASPNAQNVFSGKLRVENERAFVPLDTECSSLGSINVRNREIELAEDVIEGKKRLRCRMMIGNAVAFPTITAIDLRTLHRMHGFQAVQRRIDRGNILHLRLGLSRLFTGIHGRCYLQVNGIYGIG